MPAAGEASVADLEEHLPRYRACELLHQVEAAAVDVAQESQVEPWAARLLSSHGVPDILINNAAVINKNAPLWQVPAEQFDRLMDINVKGVANVIRH